MSNPGIKPRQSVHQTCFRTPADLECSTVRPSRARACHVPGNHLPFFLVLISSAVFFFAFTHSAPVLDLKLHFCV
ncbi:hypothetical protein ACFX10_011125 [Malus domestica]